MKKLVLTAFATVLLPAVVLAQGQVNFGTTTPGTQYIQVDDGINPLFRAPSGTLAELWWSPDNVVPYVKIGDNSVTVNGWLTTSVTATTGAGTSAGQTAWFYVKAIGVGSLVGYAGQTPNFQNVTGGPGSTPPSPASPLDGWNAPITMTIPEPSTIALAGLGVASLLLFRRRK